MTGCVARENGLHSSIIDRLRQGLAALMTLAVVSTAAPAVAQPRAWVTDQLAEVSVIDTSTRAVLATLELPTVGRGVAASLTDDRVYVSLPSADSVAVIDTSSVGVVASISVGDDPDGLAVTPDGTRVYVANRGNPDTVSVIDTATAMVVATIPVDANPRGVAIDPAGSRVFVVTQSTHRVAVIDTTTNAVVTTVPVGLDPWRVALNPEGTRAYVTNQSSASVSVIDTSTLSVVDTIAVGAQPAGIVVSPVADRAYAVNFAAGSVSVIDTSTATTVTTVAVGNGTQGIAIDPTGEQVFVPVQASHVVAVIDTSTDAVVETVPVGFMPVAFGTFISSGPPDSCPDDPDKTEPGACGCGVPDDDSDADGVPDCVDCCPEDPTKTEPGDCGCGLVDVDTDGDGALDCDDLCPMDAAKIEAGTCGCGFPDDDSDGDGLPDCLDPLACDDCEFRLLLEAAMPSLPHDPSCGEGLPDAPAPCCPLVAQAVDALTGDVLPSTHVCAVPCDEPCGSLDFDGFEAGTVITTELPGLTISGSSPVMIFDTSEPTCDDDDLATPGVGPGNVVPLGGVLILSEPGSSCAPDDARDGGVLVFEYHEPSELHSIGLLDLDDDEQAWVRTFDAAGELIKTVTVTPQASSNGWQEVLVERCGVKVVEVELTGSAAVTHLLCDDGGRRRRVVERGGERGRRQRSRALSPGLDRTTTRRGH
ncbi:MAG: YncE family protein [Acidobacteriota bacterium]